MGKPLAQWLSFSGSHVTPDLQVTEVTVAVLDCRVQLMLASRSQVRHVAELKAAGLDTADAEKDSSDWQDPKSIEIPPKSSY